MFKDRSAMDAVNDNLQRFTIILFILCPVVGLMVISLCVLTNVYISRYLIYLIAQLNLKLKFIIFSDLCLSVKIVKYIEK